jgi:hypothetical protein
MAGDGACIERAFDDFGTSGVRRRTPKQSDTELRGSRSARSEEPY